jgi:hypothetical protein
MKITMMKVLENGVNYITIIKLYQMIKNQTKIMKLMRSTNALDFKENPSQISNFNLNPPYKYQIQ